MLFSLKPVFKLKKDYIIETSAQMHVKLNPTHKIDENNIIDVINIKNTFKRV